MLRRTSCLPVSVSGTTGMLAPVQALRPSGLASKSLSLPSAQVQGVSCPSVTDQDAAVQLRACPSLLSWLIRLSRGG